MESGLGGRVTREEYWHLVETGIIGPDDRVELLEGVIVAMAPQNPPHAFVIGVLNRAFSAAAGADRSIRVQTSLDVSDLSTPEPDLAIVAGSHRDYAVAHPTTALLVVEVADSSLLQDRLTKAPIYAAAGVPEYWIVNLRERCIEVYRAPDHAARRYLAVEVRRPGDRLESTALPGFSIPVDEILPPA